MQLSAPWGYRVVVDAAEKRILALAASVQADRSRLMGHASKIAQMIDSARSSRDADLLEYALSTLRPTCVKALRDAGFTWQEIGAVFGVSVAMARKIAARVAAR